MKTRNVMVFLALLMSAPVWAGIFGDSASAKFENYQEMASSGIFEQGWLPPYLPKSAVNIEEKHDMDTNVVMATFEYDPQDTGSVQEHCDLMTETEDSARYACDNGESEAFIELRKDGSATYSSQPKVTE